MKDAGLSVEIKSVERSKDDDGGADYASFTIELATGQIHGGQL